MYFQGFEHAFQVCGQALRAVGALAMNLLNLVRHEGQSRQFLAVRLVVGDQDVFDEFWQGALGPGLEGGLAALLVAQFLQECIRGQAFLGAGFVQGDAAVAAIVHAVALEDARGTGLGGGPLG